MTKPDYRQIISERLRRHRLTEPIQSPEQVEEYLELFSLLQPVAPVHFTFPGDPPRLVHRTRCCDYDLSDGLRKKHQIVKGRFLGGRVGYVRQEDLEKYALVFRKTLSKGMAIHDDILSLIRNSGGMSKEQLKQELDYPAGEISKALQSLQEAFLVYEDQTEADWDTGWFDFATEWFELPGDRNDYHEAVSTVILNFLKAMVFATTVQIKSWTLLPTKMINQTIQTLVEEERIIRADIAELGQGYIRKEDSSSLPQQNIPKCVFMLDKSDFLVRAYMDELKLRYKGREVLQYLLIDGEFKGIVAGHWRIGPYNIEDIVLDLDEDQAEARKREVIDAVKKIYTPETHPILRYNGLEI